MAGWNGQRWFAANWDAIAWFGPSNEAGNLSGSASFGITASGDLEQARRGLGSYFYRVFEPKKKPKYAWMSASSKSVSSVTAKASQLALMRAESSSESGAKIAVTTVFNVQRTRRIASALLLDLAA